MRVTFTSAEVCELCGITPRTLQLMIAAGAVVPLIKGSKGRGNARRFSLTQAVAIAYGAAFLDANCHHDWAYEAVRFVASQTPGQLEAAFRQGRTLANLLPDHLGQSRLVKPYLKPEATREQRLMVDKLNLEAWYRRISRRAEELAVHVASKASEAE
jgi:hypothetical protein